jgi:hypothetical protein
MVLVNGRWKALHPASIDALDAIFRTYYDTVRLLYTTLNCVHDMSPLRSQVERALEPLRDEEFLYNKAWPSELHVGAPGNDLYDMLIPTLSTTTMIVEFPISRPSSRLE